MEIFFHATFCVSRERVRMDLHDQFPRHRVSSQSNTCQALRTNARLEIHDVKVSPPKYFEKHELFLRNVPCHGPCVIHCSLSTESKVVEDVSPQFVYYGRGGRKQEPVLALVPLLSSAISLSHAACLRSLCEEERSVREGSPSIRARRCLTEEVLGCIQLTTK